MVEEVPSKPSSSREAILFSIIKKAARKVAPMLIAKARSRVPSALDYAQVESKRFVPLADEKNEFGLMT